LAELVRVLGLGAGGHGSVVVETIRAAGGYDVVGFLDPRPELVGSDVVGVPVLGDDDELPRLYDDGVSHAFIGLGGAADTRPRRRLYELARSHGFTVVSVVHPSAVVSNSATVGSGATVLAGALVNTSARLGENVLVNTGAIVEHDCVVGDHVHLSTGSTLAAGVEVGEGAHIGAGSTVIQGVTIGGGSVVGAGAVVIRDVAPRTVVVGVPAGVLRTVEA
jgi:UDP-perosamine 4-acetyltransferase